MIKGMLIDFGGTIDTDGVHWYRMFRDAYPKTVSDELLREAYVFGERNLEAGPNCTFHEMLEKKVALHGLGADGVVEQCYARMKANIENVARPALEKVGLPMVLVTNFYGNMHTVLEEFGLSGLFVDVVESSVVGVRKPDPEIFRLGAKALGLDPAETVMVGDSPDKDIVPAHAAGCHTIWLKGQGWTEQVCSPDCTVTSLAQLPTAIQSFSSK